MTAQDILRLLLTKHSEKYVCVPECKTGPSGNGVQSMDLWTMKKSWSQPNTIAFEIKVSRSDFLKDSKWPGYLPFCNEFYFVCPYGLIGNAEVPADAGLVMTSKNGTNLYTKKKAPWRTVQVPEELYRYLLMWRVKIQRDRSWEIDNLEQWKRWLEKKAESRSLGNVVSKKVQETLRQKVELVQDRQRQLEREMEEFQEFKKMLTEAGFDMTTLKRSRWDAQRKFREFLEEIKTKVPGGLMENLDMAVSRMSEALEILKKGNDE